MNVKIEKHINKVSKADSRDMAYNLRMPFYTLYYLGLPRIFAVDTKLPQN